MAGIQKSFIDIDDPLIIADLFSETVGGGTNGACAVGNGRLTVGVSPWGELIYFRWPNPSYYDHLRYVTRYKQLVQGMLKVSDVRYGGDALCEDWKKYGRPYGKYQGLGACGGIGFGGGEIYWQDMPLWNSSRQYAGGLSHCLETNLTSNENLPERDINLTVTQWVMPERDLLVQQYNIDSKGADSFFYHGVFAPWMENPGTFHNPDKKRAGFAALYCRREELLVWMCPHKNDRKKILSKGADIASLKDLDVLVSGDGIYIAMGLSAPVESFQAGESRQGRCPLFKGPTAGREDAGDGTLEENIFCKGQVDGALKARLNGRKEVTVYTAVAKGPGEVLTIIEEAKKAGPEVYRRKALSAWKREGEKIFVPKGASRRGAAVAKRSIMNLLIGRDRDTGAIIASPARQPCYSCDWPRDGAFYDMALDMAGLHDTAEQHLDFYRRTQRKEKLAFNKTWLASLRSPFFRPRGHWYANMNCDGTPGFFKIIPLEIDETSLMVWDLWRHGLYVPGEREGEYRDRFKEMLIMAMEGILPYVDIKKKWTKKIMEDDDYIAKATLHGASAVLTALASGASLAEKWDLDSSRREKWSHAALALREGMLDRIEDPKVLEQAGWRGIQWSLFPAPLFDDTNRDLARPLLKKLADDMETRAVKKEGGVGYLGEQLFIFAASTFHTKEYDDLKKEVLEVLLNEAVFEGTDCFGELGLWIEFGGKKMIQNRTSMPHLWNGVTAYLSVAAMEGPELFQPLSPPLKLNGR